MGKINIKVNVSKEMKDMLQRLKPSLYIESIFLLDLEKLKDKNIKGFIIDIDDTLVEWNKKYASDRVVNWLSNIKLKGFKICLVSNNTEDRVVKFNKVLKLPAIHRAVKPRLGAFRKAMEIMGTTPETTAVIGDRLFTDVLGGNRLDLFTILVVPMSSEQPTFTRFARRIEKSILRNLLN